MIAYSFYSNDPDEILVIEDLNNPGIFVRVVRRDEDLDEIMRIYDEFNAKGGAYCPCRVKFDPHLFDDDSLYYRDINEEIVEKFDVAKAAEEAKADTEAWYYLDTEARLMGFRYRA